MEYTKEQMRAAVQALKGIDVTPKCDDHRPEVNESGTVIHCKNCGFTAIGNFNARQ